ncbi:hypothetical protein K330107F9_29050 [Bacteroides stercoris]
MYGEMIGASTLNGIDLGDDRLFSNRVMTDFLDIRTNKITLAYVIIMNMFFCSYV